MISYVAQFYVIMLLVFYSSIEQFAEAGSPLSEVNGSYQKLGMLVQAWLYRRLVVHNSLLFFSY